MPSWAVAILVAFVGLGGGLLGTFGRIAHDRESDLRSRMLDAADDFVLALEAAAESAGLASLPMMVDVRFGWQFEAGSPHQLERRAKAEAAYEAAIQAWQHADQRLPRIRLLFGVGSVAATSAQSASDAVGEAVLALAELRSFGYEHEGDEPTLEAKTDQTTEFVQSHVQAARASVDDFSRAARKAIIESRLLRRLRRQRSSNMNIEARGDDQ